MKKLSEYFLGIGYKRLSQVEIDSSKSNQHELNGVTILRNMFGDDRRTFTSRYIYFTDDKDSIIEEEGKSTWYDARENHKTRTEYRIYYNNSTIFQNAKVGDLLIILWHKIDEIWMVIAPKDSTAEQQLIWLFDLQKEKNLEKLNIKKEIDDKKEIFAKSYILEALGVIIPVSNEDYLNDMLKRFDGVLPSTTIFSGYARNTLENVPVIDDPDEALLSFYSREEFLFKIFERHFVKEKLKEGFGADGLDVEQFIAYSLHIQNRRKSRAGFSLENHLDYVFANNKIQFSRGAITERKSKPDFIFPSISFYKDPLFNENHLKMLGSKTTAKDRWRQVLSEAERIKFKHIITLEPSISISQTNEMKAQNVTLVVPKKIQSTFTKEQQNEILSLSDFISLLKENEKGINILKN